MAKTNTAENARLDMEQGQQFYPMEEFTDIGDHITFESPSATLFSDKEGFEPVIVPNGMATGGEVAPDTVNNQVDVAALTAYIAGVLTSVTASPGETAVRSALATHRITSVTVTVAGAIAMVAAADGAGATAFSETRGVVGGPPFIPVDSTEVAQIRLSSAAAALVTTQEIFQVVGQHQERYDYPVWEEDSSTAKITFISTLPLIHTGSLAKKVFGEVYDPIFAQLSLASEFVAPENSHSVASTQIYGTTVGSVSSTLGQGSFTAYLKDGVSDPVVKEKDKTLWFKFWPSRYKTPYLLAQGKLGITRSFPAGDSIVAECTISAQATSTEVSA